MNASGSDYLHDGWCMTQTHTAGTCNCHYGEIARLQERVRELEYLLDYAHYLRFVGEASSYDQEIEYWKKVEVAIKPMHDSGPSTTAGAEGEQGLDREGGVHGLGKGMGDDRDPSGA